MVRPGISILIDERRAVIDGKRIGVFTNHSGVLPDLTSSLAALQQVTDVRAIFSPEHGLSGAAAEGAYVANMADRSGTPIYSLYGSQSAPTREQLAGLDLIVCDIQDIGCRFYTYAWTLAKLIEAAAAAGVAVIVTDRPNPIGGAIEGPGVEPQNRTLVGLHDVPIRHGLTLGELAQLVNREWDCGCDLTIVPCAGWRRAMLWAETGLPWVPPSPNMPTAETALVYPGTCLLEGVNLSVGRGTAKPLEWLGAPWINGAALAAALNERMLPGVRWRPVQFQPCAAPFAGEVCAGVQPHVIDPTTFRPVAAGVALLLTLRLLYPAQFTISADGSIYADREQMARRMYPAQSAWNVAHFDRLAGSARLRELIESGAALDEIVEPWQANEDRFRARIVPVLIYD